MQHYDFVANARIEYEGRCLIPVMRSGKWGLVEQHTEQEFRKIQFDTMPRQVFDNLIYCKLDGKYGAIDFDGNHVLKFKFDSIEFVNSFDFKGFIVSVDSQTYGIYNKEGEVIANPIYERIVHYSAEAAFKVQKNNKVGVLDYEGKCIIPARYKSIEFYRDYAKVFDRLNRVGLYNLKTKRIVCPPKYMSVSNINEGYAAVCNEEGKCGFINMLGEEIVPCEYAAVGEFCNGFATVSRNGEDWGYVNTRGLEVTQLIYCSAQFVDEYGVARVSYREKDSSNIRAIQGTILLI